MSPFFLFHMTAAFMLPKHPRDPVTLHFLQSSLHKGTNAWLSWKRQQGIASWSYGWSDCCQLSVWEHWSDQQWCPRAAGGYTPKCLMLKNEESLNSCTPDAQGLHMVVQGPSQGSDLRWELCSEVLWHLWTSRALPQCLGLYWVPDVTSSFNLHSSRASCGTRSLNPSVESLYVQPLLH